MEVPRVEYDPVGAGRTIALGETGGKLTDERLGEESANIRARIEKAREIQRQRFAGRMGGANGNVPLLCNAEMPALLAQAQVWARRRCANIARWMVPARGCPLVPPFVGRGCAPP